MAKRKLNHELLERFETSMELVRVPITILSVTSGLIVAACLSGLPSTSCRLLAVTYKHGITDFGLVAFTCALSFWFLQGMAYVHHSERSFRIFLNIARYISFFAALIFLFALYRGLTNLNASMVGCYDQPQIEKPKS